MNYSVSPYAYVPFHLSPSGYTLAAEIDDPGLPEVATLVDLRDPLTRYLTSSKRESMNALANVMSDPPEPSRVISVILRTPGIDAQDRAVELLAQLAPKTLQFARQYANNEIFLRPFFSNKIWEIVIGALGLSDAAYSVPSQAFIRTFLTSNNSVKRLAAIDALESLGAGIEKEVATGTTGTTASTVATRS